MLRSSQTHQIFVHIDGRIATPLRILKPRPRMLILIDERMQVVVRALQEHRPPIHLKVVVAKLDRHPRRQRLRPPHIERRLHRIDDTLRVHQLHADHILLRLELRGAPNLLHDQSFPHARQHIPHHTMNLALPMHHNQSHLQRGAFQPIVAHEHTHPHRLPIAIRRIVGLRAM